MPKLNITSNFYLTIFFSLFCSFFKAQEIGYETYVTLNNDTVRTFFLHEDRDSIGYLDKNNKVSKIKIAKDSDEIFDYEALFFHLDTALQIMTNPHARGFIYAHIILDENGLLLGHGTNYFCPEEFREAIREKFWSLDFRVYIKKKLDGLTYLHVPIDIDMQRAKSYAPLD